MEHPNEGALLALLDAELPTGEEDALRSHLRGCGACRTELDLLRRDTAGLSGALRLLDRPPPLARARGALLARRPRRGIAVPLRRAAALVLLAGGALSATIPGSPTRGWAAEAWRRVAGAPERAEIVQAPAPPDAPQPTPAAGPAPAGVALVPGTGAVRVHVRSDAGAPGVRVRLHDGDRLEVEAEPLDGGQPRFRTAADRIEVLGAVKEVRVLAPRTGRLVLEVNGEAYLVQEGNGLRFPGPAARASAAEVVFGARR